MRAFGNTNNFNFNDPLERKIERELFGTPAAGDVCIAMSVYPGVLGQSLPQLIQGTTFTAWSNVIGSVFHTFSDTAELSGGLWIRECDGTDEDDVRISSPGPYPSATQICRLSGNQFVFPGTITSDNDTIGVNPHLTGAPCVTGLAGGWNECIEFYVCWKRATAAESLIGELVMPAGITQLGSAFGIDNGFDDGMVAAWGMHYSPTAPESFNGGDATQNNPNSAYGASVGARYKTADS